MRRQDIQIRDPFVLVDGSRYYLFGSTDKDIWRSKATGFDMYVGRSLDEFEGPFPCFRPPADFWSETNFWAPEVYRYRGAYYMFATFKPRQGRRGTAVLRSEALDRPFAPWSDGPVTPAGWECLDGTLYVDREGRPWMAFCHEWKQVVDGEIHAMPLDDDLRGAAGPARLLFRASEAPWARPLARATPPGYVTDGPSLYTGRDGGLSMLWSSFDGAGRYCLGVARSETGLIDGPWRQEPEPLLSGDGGHGMLFRGLDGELYLAAHTPNRTPLERAIFARVAESASGRLTLLTR